LDCAAIQHQKLATVRQQALAGNVMDAPHEIGISFGGVIVLRLECESARGDFLPGLTPRTLHQKVVVNSSNGLRHALGEGTRQL
jgi:hypothetical protein